jgi:hypothetical protein
LLESEDGLEELKRTYYEVCQPPEPEPEAPAITYALMIDAILEAEFPTGVTSADLTAE